MKYLSTFFIFFTLFINASGQETGNYDDLIQAGENRISQRDYYGAIDEFNEAISTFPSRPEAYAGRAAARKRLQDYNNALSDIDKATDLDPSYAEAYIVSGDIHADLQEYELALVDYNMALEQEPTNRNALNSKIIVLLQMNQTKEAQKMIEKAIESYPEYGEFYYSRGILQNSRDRFSKAIEDFDMALEKGLNTDLFGIYVNRGFSFLGLGEFDNAIADFSKAIDIDPENASGYHSRARAYYHLDNFEEAINDLKKSVELNQSNPVMYYDLGMAYLRIDDISNACENFQRSCQLGNKNACKKYLYECTTDIDDLK